MKRRPPSLTPTFAVFLMLSLLGQAQVSFFQPPPYSGGGPLFVADFNGDGKPDLLSSDGFLNLGSGNGTFTQGTQVSGTPLAVADFNGDGKPDILEQGSGTLLVLLGNGDGTFQAAISTPSGANLIAVAAADLNADGKADILGVFNSSLLVYLSKGDGTFESGVSYSLGATPSSPAVLSLGDFNGDGKTDVVVTTGGEEIVFLGVGDGRFQPALTSASSSNPAEYVAVGDFNGDHNLDLAVSNNPGNCPTGVACSAYILLGNGNGTFQAPTAAFSGAGSLAAADVDGDGKQDLIFQSDPTVAQIYLGNGNGTFSNASNYVLYLPPSSYFYPPTNPIAIADFSLDGKPDIAIGGFVLLGNGNGTFRGIQLSVTPSALAAAVTGVFDNASGLPGVAAVQNQGDSVYILKNNGLGLLSLSHTYTLQAHGYAILAADLNGDGNLDLLVLNFDLTPQLEGYSVLLGNGDGSFQSPIFHALNFAGNAALADFNNDKKVDLAIDEGNQTIGIFIGNDDGTFAAPVSYYDGGGGVPLVADFNGDGHLDIAVSAGAILFGNGEGTFQPAIFPSSLNGFSPSFTAQLTNDGHADLISYDQIALGKGDGTFTLLPVLLPPGSDQSVDINAIADLNGDGKPDLIARVGLGHFAQTGVMLGNGDGKFGPIIVVPTNGALPGALIADMNADGRPDIVFPWGSAVSGIGVMLNTTPPGFDVSTGALSPAPVTAGNSATSTVTVAPTFGFNSSVTLSCTGLPTGATCAFDPAAIANSSGTSTLTIATTASTAAGTYSLQVQGNAGSVMNSAAVSLVVQVPPGFALSAASGSPTSQTVSAGQAGSFSLDLVPSGSFTGTVNFTCAVAPVVTPASTCSMPSSVQISGSGAQTVTVKVSTTAPGTAGAMLQIKLPPAAMPWVMLLGSGLLLSLIRRRRLFIVVPIVTMALALCVGCGRPSSSSQSTPGTPAGTYTATVTASSGSVNSNMALKVIVQ